MIIVQTKETDNPSYNLAMEEYLVKQLQHNEPLLFIYINRPSIIIGRNQNPFEEINLAYAKKHQIEVVRRLSGGGTVFHDDGNLNYSFIAKNDGNSVHNYKKFTKPIIEALHKLGVPAELNERNDIILNGYKISGTAQFSYKGRVLTHGTLLFDANLDFLQHALHFKQEKRIKSKAISSKRSKVINIRDYLSSTSTMIEFKQQLIKEIVEMNQPISTYIMTEEDHEEIKKIVENRYKKWEWNIGETPAFTIKERKAIEDFGYIDIQVDVKHGIIEKVMIDTSFYEKKELAEIEKKLHNSRFEEIEMRNRIEKINDNRFFDFISIDDFLKLIIG